MCVHPPTGNEADVKAAFQSIVKEFGEYPEVLVYNAGPGNFRFPPPGILDLSVEEFSVAFEAGVYGALAWLHQVPLLSSYWSIPYHTKLSNPRLGISLSNIVPEGKMCV